MATIGTERRAPLNSRPLLERIPRVVSAMAELDLSLPKDGVPPGAVEALDEFMGRGGKRVRPALCFLVGELLGLAPERLKPCARAAEWTHAASLIHDDVIDRSVERRGRPAMHALWGATRSILAGDLLLARVMEDLLRSGGASHALALSEAIRDLSAGEWMEVDARRDLSLSPERLEAIHALKTGALLRWCAEAAPRELNLSRRTVETFGRFGSGLGICFQLMDDVLDFRNGTGKPVAQDLREGVINFVTLELISEDAGAASLLADFLAGGDPELAPTLFAPEQISQASSRVAGMARARFQRVLDDLNEGCRMARDEGVKVNDSLLLSPELHSLLAAIPGIQP